MANDNKPSGYMYAHAHVLPVKGKRRMRLDAIQRQANQKRKGTPADAFPATRMISEVAYLKLRSRKAAAK